MKHILVLFLVTTAYWGFSERVSLSYHVTDDCGIPIEGAEVTTATQKNYLELSWTSSIKYAKYIESTDRQGDARCDFDCHHGDFNVYVTAKGHYPEKYLSQSFRTEYEGPARGVRFFEHEKHMDIVLFRRLNPIPMFVYAGNHCCTVFGTNAWEKCGYDLELHDWLPPMGKGKVADLYVEHEAILEGGILSSKGRLSFDENCGAYVICSKRADKRLLIYCADTNANYKAVFTATRKRRLDKEILEQGPILEKGQALVLRTRVKTDGEGKIISCRYAKIYGPFLAAGEFRFSQSCFNPKDNDPNVEFDIRHNLSKTHLSGFVP